MKEFFKKAISIMLAAVILFGAAPLAGFVGLDLPELNLFNIKAEAYSGKCGADLTYTLNTGTGVFEINGTGDMYDYTSTGMPWRNDVYRIESVKIGSGVTGIGEYTFYDCTNLTSLTIPDNVTKIGAYAISGCDNLSYVSIGNGVTELDSSAFNSCDNLSYITIGKNVTDIRTNFLYNKKLQYISVHQENPAYTTDENGVLYNKDKTILLKYPVGSSRKDYTIFDGVKIIGASAFYECKTIESISMPDSLEEIENRAFYRTTALKSIVFGNNLKKIGESAFSCYSWSSSGLESIVLPNSVEEIGDSAFYQRPDLNTIVIGDAIKRIGINAFYGSKYYSSTENWDEYGLYIGNHLIKADTSISGSHTLKDGTMCIADEAFSNNKNLTVIRMPSSVTHIGNKSFYNCQGLQRVILSEGTKSIGNNAFQECIKLASINIPDSIERIGEYAFNGCDVLTSFVLSETSNLNFLGQNAFRGCVALAEVSLPDSLTEISYGLFIACSSLKNAKLPQNATNMGDAVFYNCTRLETVNIPNGIKNIGKNTFYNCYALSNVIIPETVESIGERAFYENDKLLEIIIPESVKSIDLGAFQNCTNLSDITLPDGIINIGSSAFYGTKYYNDNANWENNVLYIDNHLIQAKTSISGDYAVVDGTKSIADYAFSGCSSLTGISVPEGLVSIGDYAFTGCSSLETMYIPSTVTIIGEYCCKNATFLNDVYYNGCEKEWNRIDVAPNNDYLLNAIFHFTHYYITWVVDGVETAERIKVGDAVSVPDDPSKDYYTFSGWDKQVPATMPEQDYVITAQFTPIAYNATFVIDGETFATVSYTVETESIENPALPKRDGYTESWESYTLTPGGITVNAIYTADIYNAVFTVDGATVSTISYTVETESITPPEIPEKAGYTSKWADYELTIGGITVDAIYTPITYHATFVIDGETVSKVPYTVETNAIVAPTLPVREGYTEKWEDYELTIGGITVNAIYSINPHTVTWNVDGEETTDNYNYGDTIVKPADPEKEGYTFMGWTPSVPATVPDMDLTFTATWQVNNYTVTWDVDGEITTETYDYGTSINKPANPVKEGYTFVGWTNDVPATMPANDLEFVAEWSVNSYVIYWDDGFGNCIEEYYSYGDTIVKPADPKIEGYTFVEWLGEIPETVPAEDLYFLADWIPNKYNVTWDVDGVITTETYYYEAKIVKPADPVKEGYTFVGWTIDVPTIMPANDLEFVAEWSINPHTVTWIIDDEETTDTYNYGDTIVKPADPEKEGYTFTGWDAEIPATVPDEDLVFTATWQVNNYTVTWNVDGVITTETYDYGTKIVKPATPEKEGYTFKDWTIAVPATMPANNLDFVATWDINTYSITWNIGDTVETTEFDYGETVIPPEVNVDGYEFIKWIPDVPATMPAEDLEFTAMIASTAFDSGWGTEDNPYIISTKEQLDEARNHLGSSFKLANDIVFTESDFASSGAFYNSGRGWNPINLYGTFDGDGHVIKGLKINARITASTEYPYIGLFGMVSGTVKNLGLVDGEINVTVTNADETGIGAIAAFADANSKITNCFNTCDINIISTKAITVNYSNRTFADAVAVGGIIGMGPAEISECFNNGDVSVDASVKITPNSYYTAEIDIIPVAGGITGGTSTVKDCYNTGDIDVNVTATRGGTSTFTTKDYLSLSAMAGGISGMMSDVTNCYNEGNVNATITDNYKSSNKLNVAIGGGIAAGVGENNTVSNCYNTGKVTGTTLSGAIAAYSEGTVENCYYLNNNDIGVGEGEDITVPCTPEEMASESTYEGFDFENTWVIGTNSIPKLGSNTVSTEKVEISDAELSVVNKETAQLTANLVPAYSTYQGVIWSSSDEDVATVDENGLVTAKKIGETTIKASSADGKAFAECKVTVTPADFTIIWIVDGVETEETVTETNAIVEPETPVKYGYTFSGWTPDVPDVMPDENLTFSGTWISVECELIFDATTGSWADGATKKTETVDFDSKIAVPEAPSKAGYIFLGWALNNVNVGTDLGVMDDENGKRFTAVWVPSTDTRYAVETYTMNTEGEYVKTVQNFTGETDSTANAEYNIKTGFTLNTEKSVLNGVITADNSLVLKVYIDRNVYTFTTVVDGVSTETEYFYESTIAEPATPSKTGYTFVDWDVTVPATMPAKDVTITAEFEANSYDAVFNANGGDWSDGSTSKTVATDFDSKIIAPANPTRQGYDFVGWNYEIDIMDNVNGKIFIAGWNARNDTKYTLETYTMDVNGKYVVTTETKQGTTDSSVSVSANAATGFTFNGNKSVLNGKVASDGSLVLSIYYDRNIYAFTTVVDGKTTTTNYYYDKAVTKPANPVKAGYKFMGWDKTIPSKMPANDVTVTANFELSFKMSIRNPSTTTISYGDKIILHADTNEALPSGWKIKWTADNGNFSYSASGDGTTCTISPNKSGDTTFTATVYDENGNEISKDTQTMKSKAGFFDKIIAFFRGLFGGTKVIPQAFKGIF